MKLKQELGKRIVADFHGLEAAEHAAQDWSRMFQKDESSGRPAAGHREVR